LKHYFEKNISDTYWQRFQQYGPSAKGSYWASEARQELRFKLIIEEIFKLSNEPTIELADIGCGYGAFISYIKQSNYLGKVKYTGYDVCANLIKECKKKEKENWINFEVGTEPRSTSMFTIMSGTYNLAATLDLNDWESYVKTCLKNCWKKTSKGMVFNLQIAKVEEITKTYIYYANQSKILELCVSLFGPTKMVTNSYLPNDITFSIVK
jgi:2-polyprenyl-3-methyl-5-hydroxy-6-metoxy-1,4-benzoquinol methylase